MQNIVEKQKNVEVNSLELMGKKAARENRISLIKRFYSNRSIIFGSVVALIFILIAIFAPLITPFDPLKGEGVNRYLPPSSENIAGTDEYGRDVFSRMIYGFRVSLIVGFSVAAITSVLGLIFGLVSAYYRKLDGLLMRINDAVMSFPEILLAIAIMAALGASVTNVIVATSFVFTPHAARIVRARALVVREQTYIEAMHTLGAKNWRILWLHIAPNCLPPLLVQASIVFALSILIEASLSFLGAGTPLPTPSLGNIISDGKTVLNEAWWMTIFPGSAIVLVVLSFYMLGDGLSNLLDPNSNKRK